MFTSILSFDRNGFRSSHAPELQYWPTFADVKELTTSGTFPLRIAAVILSSLMPPTTLTVTPGCFLSYSATTPLKAFSSAALQPTQIVMLSAFAPDVPAVAELLAVAAISAAPSTSAPSHPIPTRLMPCLPWGDCRRPRSPHPAPSPSSADDLESRKGSELGLYD